MPRDELLELVAGPRRAVIGRRGASLLRLQDDGLDLIQPAPTDAAVDLACGVTLAPWPNRVRGARWEHRGRRLLLEATEPGAGNALHGLVATTVFTVRDRTPDRVRLATRIAGEPGYPFALNLEVTYVLGDDGLRVEQAVQNTGVETAPVALGAHPYLCLGSQDVRTLELVVPAGTTLLLSEDHLPRDQASVAGTPYDLRRGSEVGRMPGHAVYTDFIVDTAEPAPAVHHLLRGREGTLELWTSSRMRWLQVYRTVQFPAPEGTGTMLAALAIEPMTAPPDALNSGLDLEWVAPGASWAVSWGLRLLR